MKSKLVSSFLGGFFGILLSGYVYHLGGEHYFFLVPLGIFFGSLMGFFWFNIKEVMSKVSDFVQDSFKVNLEKIFYPFSQLLSWILSIKIQFNMKDFFRFFVIAFRSLKLLAQAIWIPVKRIVEWTKAHPMNVYLLQEVIVLLAMIAGVVKLVIVFDVFQEPISFFKFIFILSVIGGMIGSLIFLAERDVRIFYSDWQFYSRYGFFGVLVKSISRVLLFAIFVSTVFMIILLGVVLMGLYAIALLLLSFLFIGIIATFLFILRLVNNQRELSSLIITMIITFISYFIYRGSFSEEIIIWLVAFGTGSISSLAVWFALSFDKGWIIKKFESVYLFLSEDDSDMEKVATYKQSWTGVMVWMPGNWVIQNIYGQIMEGGAYLVNTVNLRMR